MMLEAEAHLLLEVLEVDHHLPAVLNPQRLRKAAALPLVEVTEAVAVPLVLAWDPLLEAQDQPHHQEATPGREVAVALQLEVPEVHHRLEAIAVAAVVAPQLAVIEAAVVPRLVVIEAAAVLVPATEVVAGLVGVVAVVAVLAQVTGAAAVPLQAA